MPRPRVPSPFSPGFQSAICGDLLDHRPGARVLHVRKPERDRVGAGRERQFVHEGFRREHVGVGAERAQRGHADRHLLDEMVHDPLVREIVERDRVAVAAAGRLRRRGRRPHLLRLGEIPGGEQVRAVGRLRARGVANCSTRRSSSRRCGLRRRARPWPASPSPARRAPRRTRRRASTAPAPACPARAREQRRVERDVVGAVVAVAARAFDMDAADRRGRHLQRLGDLGAQRKHALRVRPDRELAVLELGDRGRRADRGMRHVGLGVGRLDAPWARSRAAAPACRRSPRPWPAAIFRCSKSRRRIGQRRPAFHWRSRRAPSRALIACSSRSAITPRNVPSRTTAITPGIALPCASSTDCKRRAVLRRPHHAAVHHAGQAHVLHVHRLPVTLPGMSKRGIDWPTILCCAGGFGRDLAVASRFRSTAPASSP